MTLDDPIAARGFQYKHGDRPLEGYTIQRAAGRGGFGEVYYAISDSGREVALKVVHTYEQIELRGISQCMNLKNPHLVTIFDVKYGEDGRPWVIMEFVSGPSLREMLDASPSGLGVAKAAFFLREIGKGLSYLHDCGIVHRDLKPGNIFYENGIVKIGDYGLSKTMSMSRHSGQTVAVGTLHYMAPEIGDGRYDRSIDIYAMGAMLFEMLTGQVPFYGSSPAEVLMKHLSSNVDLAGVEEPLKSVIAKAMAKNPADRYQSVQEMVEAVFGSEEVRNSVSQFSPASLTMVAGRAARNIGASPPPPRTARQNATDDPWVHAARRFEEGFQRAGRKFQEAGDRFATRMSGQRFRRYPRWQSPEQAGASRPLGPRDPIALVARIFLMLAAATATALLVGANTGHNSDEMAMFAWLSIAGAMIGLKLAWRFMAPGLAGESQWFKRFSLGAPAAFAALIFSFPTWVEGRSWHSQHVLLATFIGLCALDWEARLTPNRKQRFSVGHLFTAGILGFVLGSMFEVDETIVAATLAGASLAASLLAAHRLLPGASPPGAAPYPNNSPPPPPGSAPTTEGAYTPEPPSIPPAGNSAPFSPRVDSAPAPGEPTAPRPYDTWMWPVMVAGFGGVLLVLAGITRPILVPQLMPFMIVALVLVSKRGGRMSFMYAGGAIPAGAFGNSDSSSSIGGFFSGVARGVVALIGGALLIFSLLLTLAAATNLPGLLRPDVLNARQYHDLQYALGPNPDRMLREMGYCAAFVLAGIATAMLLLARRRGGGLHMIRAIAGIAVLFAAVRTLAKAMPDWADFIVLQTPGESIDWYLNHVDSHGAITAAVIGALGWLILCWPRKTRPAFAVPPNSWTPDAKFSPAPPTPSPNPEGANPQ
jgi:hypothetical protein